MERLGQEWGLRPWWRAVVWWWEIGRKGKAVSVAITYAIPALLFSISVRGLEGWQRG